MPGYDVIDAGSEKVSVLQTPITQKRTTYYGQQEKYPDGYEPVNQGAEKVSVLQTPWGNTRTTFYDKKDNKQVLAQEDPVEAPKSVPGYESVDAGAEKVHVLQTPIAATRTTFYDKNNKKKAALAQKSSYKDYDKDYNKRQWILAQKEDKEAGPVAGWEAVDHGAEKVHVLDPGRDATLSNSADAFPGPYRTAFYAQVPFYDSANGLYRY